MEQFIGKHEDKLWFLTHCISDQFPVIMCTSISKISHQNVQQCRHFTDKNVNLFSKALSESDIILCYVILTRIPAIKNYKNFI